MTSRGGPFRTRLECPDQTRAFALPARKGDSDGDFCLPGFPGESPFDNTLTFCVLHYFCWCLFSARLCQIESLAFETAFRSRRVKEISLASMARPQQARSAPPRQSPGSPSDKENLENSARSKRKSQTHTMSSSRNNTKRQRLGDRASNIQGGRQPLSEQQRQASKQFYDPDQDTAERRRVRKGLRDLTRELNGNTPLPIIWGAC